MRGEGFIYGYAPDVTQPWIYCMIYIMYAALIPAWIFIIYDWHIHKRSSWGAYAEDILILRWEPGLLY